MQAFCQKEKTRKQGVLSIPLIIIYIIQQDILSPAYKALVYLLISMKLARRKIYTLKTELLQIFSHDTISVSIYGCESWKYQRDKHV